MNAAEPKRAGLSPRRLALLLAALVLVGGAGLLLQDFVRSSILGPLIDLGWLIWVIFQALPQIIFWAVFILVALVLAGRSLFSQAKINIDRARPWAPHRAALTRFRYWQRGLESMGGNTFSRERIVRELQHLVLDVLAEHDRIEPEEMRRRLINGELDVSNEIPAIQALLDSSKRGGLFEVTERKKTSLWDWILEIFHSPSAKAPTDPIDVPEVVAWLEKETGKLEPERGDALGTEYR
jgi:hypothetical protein